MNERDILLAKVGRIIAAMPAQDVYDLHEVLVNAPRAIQAIADGFERVSVKVRR